MASSQDSSESTFHFSVHIYCFQNSMQDTHNIQDMFHFTTECILSTTMEAPFLHFISLVDQQSNQNIELFLLATKKKIL